jgi:predicted peroxiredoxin
MRGLTLFVATGDAERLHAALSLAAVTAATGAKVRLHLHEGAVALLREPLVAPNDALRGGAGLPTLAELWGEALAVSLCQSGLAMSGLRLDELDPRLDAQGPAGLLSELGDDLFAVF